MLFFRLNKTTIRRRKSKDPNDSLWGLAWRVKEIAAFRKSSLGIQSEIKKGILFVMTIIEHTHGQTLIIEQVKEIKYSDFHQSNSS